VHSNKPSHDRTTIQETSEIHIVLFKLYGEIAQGSMDAAVCGVCENEIKEMTVAEQDASHNQSTCSLFSCIGYILLKP
jgi:hypothetical protein